MQLTQVLLAAVCTQFIRVYDLSNDAAAPVHTFYLPATAEDASGDGAGSCIRDVVLVPVTSAPMTRSPPAPAPASGGVSGESTVPALLATAIVLTGAGRLYGKGLPAPTSSEPGSGGGGAPGYVHDGEIRHRLLIPPPLEEEAMGAADGRGGGSGPGRSGGGAGTARGGGGDESSESVGGGRGGRSESVGGASADIGGGSGRDEEEVESPVSGMDSPSYLYLSAFAGCDFDDVVNDSPDESLIFAEPGLRRRGWTGSSAAASSSSAAAAVSAADAVLAMSPARLAKASAEAAETAAASFGSLHFSGPTGLLVVARGGKSTLALRLRGAGATTEVGGGFVLLPRLASGVGAVAGASSSEGGATPVATPVAQGASASSLRSEEGTAAAAAAAAATTLEANSCLPPYTRFLDYWDGAGDLAGENGSEGNAVAAATASLACVATGGGRVKADRVLAMRAGGGSGEGHTVRASLLRVGWVVNPRGFNEVGTLAVRVRTRALSVVVFGAGFVAANAPSGDTVDCLVCLFVR